MPPELHFEPARLDLTNVVADLETIRKINPHRFDMEQLTAIVHIDSVNHIVAGYKDVRDDEFWVRGHMPGYPLMPGVLMCEAAAQLCSFYILTFHLMPGDVMAFGGMENVRFRSQVRPGDRLILVGKAVRVHRRQSTFNVQGLVGSNLVFHGDIIGVPLIRKPEA
jgi:3-hydroxyacyl-[acyl-carrier-protein] dehydratase